MEIQLKIDAICALIEKISETKEHRKDPVLAAEFLKMSEDPSLPKVFRDFCANAAVSTSGNSNGPLDNASKKNLKEIFMKLKVESKPLRL